MNANQIKNHLAQVFEQDYQGYEYFVEHVINLIFTGDDAYEALPVPEEIIDDSNRKAATNAGIQSILKIGRIDTIGGIDVYDITLRDNKQLQYNRVGIQQLIRSQQIFYSSAFLLFHNEHPKGKEWRFSFFYKEGKNKDTTSAKRFTYLFGQDFRARTASERFTKLVNEEKDTQNLLDAFSVEALSKAFFNEYKDLYNQFCDFLFKHRADVDYFGQEFLQWEDKYLRDYVKKMMGRITFIYFLQRKGWMNGDMEYMQKAFANSACQDDYLDAFLEPLFFGVLNTKPEDRKALFAKEGWNLSLLEEWKDVPYLNGGLFERDDQDKPKSKFPAEMFKDLFDFYARYNFTIDENDPDDAEVGVDPEMLGHIFENLLEDNKDKGAFYTPKEIVRYMSEESIAQYLKTHAEEALHPAIDALIKEKKVDEVLQNKAVASAIYALLQEVKVCDPAIGSGAFPMGVLNVLYHARLMLYGFIKPQHEFSPADVKREIIQNNIYGVDIEKGAIDIARLRFWLSIVVDSNRPEALPNFDYKFMQGNSLLEEFGGIDLSSLQDQIMQTTMYEPQRDLFGKVEDSQMKMTFTQKETANNLQANLEKYFSIDDHSQKQVVKEEISNSVKIHISYNIELRRDQCLCLIQEANEAISDEESKIEDIKTRFSEDKMPVSEIKKHEKKISDLNKTIDRNNKKVLQYDSVSCELETIDLTSNESFFLWHTWFKDVFDKGGFDVVIGNPPYLRIQGIRESNPVFADQLVKLFKSATGSFDLYVTFVEKGLNLIHNQGVVNFIMPTKWTNSAFGKGLRALVSEKKAASKIINFGAYQVFNASTYTGLQWFIPNSTGLKYFELNKDLSSNEELKQYLDSLSDEQATIISSEKLSESQWILTNNTVAEILNRLKQQPRRIKDVFEKIFQGLATSKDDVYFIYDCFEDCECIIGESKQLGRKVQIEKGLVKPLLKGEDVHKYDAIRTNRYVIFPYLIQNGKAILYTEKELSNLYPLGYTYLKECEDVLRDRENGRLKSDEFWYRYIYPKNLALFDNEKLVAPEISYGGNFAYDFNGEFYSTTKIYGYIKKKDVIESYKFWMALFNSRLFWFFIQNTGYVLRGGYYTFKTDYINPFPVPNTDTDCGAQNIVEQLVDYIIYLNDSSNSDILSHTPNKRISSHIEEIVDMVVYELYFEQHMKDKQIDVVSFLNTYTWDNGHKDIQKEIESFYLWYQQSENPIRQRIMLLETRSRDLLYQIHTSYTL